MKDKEEPANPEPGAADAAGAAPPGSEASGGSDIHTYIGKRLRQAFDDVAKQPVPDRFLDLMAQLDKS